MDRGISSFVDAVDLLNTFRMLEENTIKVSDVSDVGASASINKRRKARVGLGALVECPILMTE